MNTEFEPQENIIVTISCSYTNSENLIRIFNKHSTSAENSPSSSLVGSSSP